MNTTLTLLGGHGGNEPSRCTERVPLMSTWSDAGPYNTVVSGAHAMGMVVR